MAGAPAALGVVGVGPPAGSLATLGWDKVGMHGVPGVPEVQTGMGTAGADGSSCDGGRDRSVGVSLYVRRCGSHPGPEGGLHRGVSGRGSGRVRPCDIRRGDRGGGLGAVYLVAPGAREVLQVPWLKKVELCGAPALTEFREPDARCTPRLLTRRA